MIRKDVFPEIVLISFEIKSDPHAFYICCEKVFIIFCFGFWAFFCERPMASYIIWRADVALMRI